MTLKRQSALQYETTIVPHLLSVPRVGPGIATALMFNAARRAFARVCAVKLLAEPDWDVWIEEIMETGAFAASDLLMPENHLVCNMLQADAPSDTFDIGYAYRRAFHGELLANKNVYFAFFQESNVPNAILTALDAQCRSEALLRDLEVMLEAAAPLKFGEVEGHADKIFKMKKT